MLCLNSVMHSVPLCYDSLTLCAAPLCCASFLVPLHTPVSESSANLTCPSLAQLTTWQSPLNGMNLAYKVNSIICSTLAWSLRHVKFLSLSHNLNYNLELVYFQTISHEHISGYKIWYNDYKVYKVRLTKIISLSHPFLALKLSPMGVL